MKIKNEAFFLKHYRTFLANILLDFSHVCPRCNLPETTLHVIRDCIWAIDVWIALSGQRPINFFWLPLAS